MEALIENWIREYERGRLSRRALVQGLATILAGVTAARRSAAQESPSTFRAKGLNHIALRVQDIVRSRDFYQKHLGLRVSRENSWSCFLSFGESFLTLFRGSEPGLDHYCYAIEDFSLAEAEGKLRALGIAPRVRGGRIYFDDPDGLEVQLAASGHQP